MGYFQLYLNNSKIGLIGLAEIEWVQTLMCLTVDDVKYEDFVSCANRYAKKLRVEEGCEIVIALTHMRNVILLEG